MAEVQQRTAEQMFRVLGELKGGAMKVGQAMSVFEAALPEELAAPYRASLAQLQEAAPALPADRVHAVLAEQIGPRWRQRFLELRRRPGRGRVDRPGAPGGLARRPRGRGEDPVPGSRPGAAVRPDPDRTHDAHDGAAVSQGMDMAPLVDELQRRMDEELDYRREARSQRAFRKAYADDADFLIPDVIACRRRGAGHRVGRTARRCARSSRPAPTQARTAQACCSAACSSRGPARARLLHADPHPGNFRLLDDGRLAILDFGAVDRLPRGLPRPIGVLARRAIEGDADGVLDGLCGPRASSGRSVTIDADELLDYLVPLLEPLRHDEFHFDGPWLRAEALRLADLRKATTGHEAQPAAVVPAHPPRDAGRHGCALPARQHRPRSGASASEWLPGFAGPA